MMLCIVTAFLVSSKIATVLFSFCGGLWFFMFLLEIETNEEIQI